MRRSSLCEYTGAAAKGGTKSLRIAAVFDPKNVRNLTRNHPKRVEAFRLDRFLRDVWNTPHSVQFGVVQDTTFKPPDAKRFAAALRRRLELTRHGVPKRLLYFFIAQTAEWIARGAPRDHLPLFTRGALLNKLKQLDEKGALSRSRRAASEATKREEQLGDTLDAALSTLTQRAKTSPFAQHEALPNPDTVLLKFGVEVDGVLYPLEATGFLSKNRAGLGFLDDDRVGLLVRVAAPTAENAAGQQEGVSAPKEAVPLVSWNVPFTRNPTFTGRDVLLDELFGAPTTREPRIDVLTGLGGVGKSHVAVEAAYRAREFAPLIWWIRATDNLLAEADLRALATELQIADEATPTPDAVRGAIAWLEASEGWFLVFDGADSADVIAPLLPRIGRGRIVITSLNPAWHGIGRIHELEAFDPTTAIAFLARRSGVTEGGGNVLADELGYLPLALEYAAAYIEATGIGYDTYIDLYRARRKELLAKGASSHLSAVVTTWMISIEHVAEQNSLAVELLNFAAQFAAAPIPRDVFDIWGGQHNQHRFPTPSGVPPTFFEKLLGYHRSDRAEIAVAIGALRRYSLVNARSRDVLLHRLLRDVVLANLGPRDIEHLQTAAVGVVSSLFQRQAVVFHESDLATALLPHIQEVSRPQSVAGTTEVVHLLSLLARYLDERGSFEEAATVLIDAERRCQKWHPEPFIHLTVLTKLAAVYRVLFRIDDAFAALGRAWPIADQLRLSSMEERLVMVEFLNQNAVLATDSSDGKHFALGLLERALAIIDEGGLPPDIAALTQANYGSALAACGQVDEGVAHLRYAIELDRETFGDTHPVLALRWGALGAAYRNANRLIEARRAFYEDVRIQEATHGSKHPMTVLAKAKLGMVALMLPDAKYAFELFDDALHAALQIAGFPHHMISIRQGRAMALELLDRVEEALAEIDFAIALAREAGDAFSLPILEDNRKHILLWPDGQGSAWKGKQR